MTPTPRSSSPIRPFAIVAGVVLLIATAASFVGTGVGANCAYVAPAQRQHPIGPYIVVGAPPFITFFVLAYVALGLRSRLARASALIATLVITAVVGFLSLVYLEPYCGF